MLNCFHQSMPSSYAYYLCTFSTAFDSCFLIRIYRYTCIYFCTPFGIHLATRRGASDSPGLVCLGSEAWTEVEPSAEDQAYLSE